MGNDLGREENKMNCVIRYGNPIMPIYDHGAGSNGNVLKKC